MRGRSRGGRAFPLLSLAGAGKCSAIVRAVVRSSRNGGQRVVAARTERLASGKAPGREPCSTDRPVADHGFAGVVGARGKKTARSAKRWREQQLVAVDQRERQHGSDARTTALAGSGLPSRRAVVSRTFEADGDFVRCCCGIRSQGQSEWRRATRAWEPRRRQSQAQSCDGGKPLESGVSLYFSQPRPPGACQWAS